MQYLSLNLMDKKRLYEKVELLRNNSPEGLYVTHDKAADADISFFESKFGVNIPEDLKWFVLNIANGITDSKHPGSNVIDKIHFNNFYYEEDAYNPALQFKPTQRVVTGMNTIAHTHILLFMIPITIILTLIKMVYNFSWAWLWGI